MDHLIISLNLTAAVLTLLYIAHLIGQAVDENWYGDKYFHIKRSLLNQQVSRRV